MKRRKSGLLLSLLMLMSLTACGAWMYRATSSLEEYQPSSSTVLLPSSPLPSGRLPSSVR